MALIEARTSWAAGDRCRAASVSAETFHAIASGVSAETSCRIQRARSGRQATRI